VSNETIPNDHPIWEFLLALNKDSMQQPTLNTQADLISHFINTSFGGKLWLKLFDLPEALELESSAPSEIEQKLLENIKLDHQAIHEFNTQLQLHYLGLPLMQQEKLIGVMIISRQDQPFNQEDTRYLQVLSHIAAISFNAIIQSQLQRFWQKQLNLVSTVSAQLVNITDLDILTQEISQLIRKTFDYYYVAIFTHEPKSKELIFRASARSLEAGQPHFEYLPGAKLKIGEHIVGYVAQSGEQLLANDVTKEPRYGHLDSLSKTRSEVALPLMINRKVIGVLDVQSDQLCAFDENNLLLLNALADNIAIAIHRVRLYNVARIRAEQMATIAEVSQAITYIFDLDKLLNKVVSLIHKRYAFPYVHVFITQPAQNRVVFKAGSGDRSAAFKEAKVSYDLETEKGIIPWVAKHGKLKRINNVMKNPQFISNPLSQDFTGSELALPLVFGKEVLGVLDIQSDKVNAFTNQDQELLKTLSANIAIAIRNAKLYHSELWRRQVAESLRDVAVLITNNTALDNVLNIILDELQKILPCDIVAIWLFDDKSQNSDQFTDQNLRLAAVHTNNSIDDELLSTLSGSSTAWFNHALGQDTPLVRDPADSRDPIAAALNLPENYSAIAAPLQTAGQTLGLLTLIHHTPGRYGYESQNITASFASYAAISIENARLFESSQEQAWISTVLLQVAQATQSLSTIPELVSTVVRLPPLLAGVEGCALFLRESETDIFMLHAIYGITHKEEDLKEPLSVGTAPIFSDLMLTQSPMVVHNPKLELNLPDDIISGLEGKTLVILPLITHNELLGAFLLIHNASFSGGKYTDILSDERLAIIQGITQQTAIAVENIRLLEAKQEEAYVSAVLLQVAQAVVSNATLDDVLESIVHIMPILVGIDYSIIYLWEPDTEKFFTKHIHYASAKVDEEKELLENTYAVGEFPILDAVKASNKVILHPFETILPPEDWDLAIPDETIEDITPILNSHYGLLMGFPLAVNNEVLGVLITQELNYNQNRERRFELLTGVAQQISLAIQNDQFNKERVDRERLERDFQLAREIQQTFLPEHLPIIPGYESDVRWHTARQVGGDFYDIFERSQDQYGIVIADVSDKGLAASLYMTVTRTLLRAVALEIGSTAKTLEKVNDLLLLDSQTGFFVTVFYAILDCKDGSIRYTNAGHNPPYVLQSSTNEVIELKRGGIAIGAMQNINLPESNLKIENGDCLVLHTDGVTEAFDALGNMYGDSRYKKILHQALHLSAKDTLNLIETDLNEFRHGTALSDDTTLLSLKRKSSLANKHRDADLAQDRVNS